MTSMNVLLHAPTAAGLTRARGNARNLLRARPQARVLIIANGAGVREALDNLDPDMDSHLRLCRNSLHAQQLDNRHGIQEVEAAVVAVAELQAQGWCYIRA